MSEEKRCERLRSFLADIRDVCASYGYRIGGCGCCGSPWVSDVNSKMYAECLFVSSDCASVWCDGEEVTDER